MYKLSYPQKFGSRIPKLQYLVRSLDSSLPNFTKNKFRCSANEQQPTLRMMKLMHERLHCIECFKFQIRLMIQVRHQQHRSATYCRTVDRVHTVILCHTTKHTCRHLLSRLRLFTLSPCSNLLIRAVVILILHPKQSSSLLRQSLQPTMALIYHNDHYQY